MIQNENINRGPSKRRMPAALQLKFASTGRRVWQRSSGFEQSIELATVIRDAFKTQELPELIKKAAEIANPNAISILLYNPADQTLRQVFAAGIPVFPLWLKPGEGIGGTVFITGQPYFSNDMREDLLANPTERALVKSRLAAGCFPIHMAQEVIGVFFITFQSLPASIKGNQSSLLTASLEMVGTALHRFQLEEQAKRQIQQLDAMRAIDLAITSSLDLGGILEVLLDQVIAQLGVDAACVLVHNPGEQTLEFAATRGFTTDALQRTHLRFGEGYAGRAATEQRTILIPDLRYAQADFVRSPSFSAEGFVAYFAVPLMARSQVKGVLEIFHRAPIETNREWLNLAEAMAGQAAIAIENATLIRDLQRSNTELNLTYTATLEGWSRALDLRDRETEGHSQRVTELALRLAKAMGVGESELVHIRRGALLHDIGKLGIPDSILLKSSPLNEAEMQIVRKHPVIAYELLAPIGYLQPALDLIYAHHEKWDGSGYPRGLKGEEIPLSARIFTVVDVWDALLTDRPYRKGWPEESARNYLLQEAGRHFDPQIVSTFLTLLNETDKPGG